MNRILSPAMVTALVAGLGLAACSGGPPRMPRAQIERALAGAPGAAQPSKVVAAEIAFARAAREDGQWTAFREFAADGAMIHGRGGLVEAKPWLAAQDDPARAVQWTPLAVWMSCDGRTAISQGKFADPDGDWGYYVTVWEQQGDRTYRYVYDTAAPDAVLTARETRDAPAEPEDADIIVVEAIPMVQGMVADCARGDNRPTAAPLAAEQPGAKLSRDGTLAWSATHVEDGRRVFRSQLWQDGAWQEALDFEVSAAGAYVRP